MKKSIFIFSILFAIVSQAQSIKKITITVLNENKQPIPAASVQLLKPDSTLQLAKATNEQGVAFFDGQLVSDCLVKVSHTGYQPHFLTVINLEQQPSYSETVMLQTAGATLGEVVVRSKKPFIQFLPDKTVINVEAGITNAGATAMDVLEKSPGVTIGRDGTIMMKGKPQVMVLIDGRPTQLGGTELQAYLSGINASQLEVIELIENPGAKYDAAGNAGIINIKTKTNKQVGFNGNLSLSIGQGIYTKSNNSLNLNYRSGKFNLFLNYGTRLGKEKMDMYALRKYFDVNGKDSLWLEQPNINKSNITSHNLKAGFDFFASSKTTLGFIFNGNLTDRKSLSISTINWMTPQRKIDSTILTWGNRNLHFKRGGINLNARHSFNSNNELLVDLDFIKFNINGYQYFQTELQQPGSTVQATQGDLPSALTIITGKFDYSRRMGKFLWESGIKTANTKTDNLAAYFTNNGSSWQDNPGRSNHFLYDETIQSLYSSLDAEQGKWHWQLGLRYENTSYKANQLGNSVVKDSSFRKNYSNIFPSAFASYNLDSNHNFTLRLGRRIDRPPFQNLNPFLVALNKYTYEGGNPFIRPQYTWNVELVHTFKQMLSTGISYSYLHDYFSQLFIIDSSSSNVNKNIIVYTRGNVGSFQNIGATINLQMPITKWWSITGTAVFNHKIIKGVVWKPIQVSISQFNLSLNNQFQFKNGWSAELSGYYLSNSQIDLQESLTPQGEMNLGVSKQIMKGKGTLRLTVRDLFYTQNYSGYSLFEGSDEPFRIKWDSRVARLSFTWRFGKAMKPIKRSEGSATEETERAGNGG